MNNTRLATSKNSSIFADNDYRSQKLYDPRSYIKSIIVTRCNSQITRTQVSLLPHNNVSTTNKTTYHYTQTHSNNMKQLKFQFHQIIVLNQLKLVTESVAIMLDMNIGNKPYVH